MKDYEQQIRDKISSLSPIVYSTNFSFEHEEDTNTHYFSGSILFIDKSRLEFSEMYSRKGHRYRFHYMDKARNLIFRFDNAPHHPEVKSFPHHQHTSQAVIPSREVNLLKIFDLIVFQVEIS